MIASVCMQVTEYVLHPTSNTRIHIHAYAPPNTHKFYTCCFVVVVAGGITKWELVDSGPSMIAPYGTRVGALTGSEPICLDLTQSDDNSSATATGGASAGVDCDIEETAWWSQIRAGSLVDAKDLQGVWYQVHHYSTHTDTRTATLSFSYLSADRSVPFHLEF